MKKIVKFLLIYVIINILLSFYSYANAQTSMKMKIDLNESSIKTGNEIIFNLYIQNLNEIGEGVNAYILTLNYNVDELEFIKAEGENSWNTPTYNENTLTQGKIKFVATRPNFTKESGKILKLVFKSKQNFEDVVPDVNITDISFAAKVNNNTTKLQIEDLKLQKSANTRYQELPKVLPKTGKNYIVGIGVIFTIIILILYCKYKKIGKYVD